VLASWRDVLQLKSIGVDDNFFDLGGHSLLAVKVHRRLAETFARTIAITDLFRFPTVRVLAEFLADGDAGTALQASHDRAALRRQALAGRRARGGRAVDRPPPGAG
jgi:acyl carrier protein